MLPLHLLIQNLLYDVSQVAIPFDNVDDEQIQKPQRWNPADLGRFMLFFGPISSIFDILTFCLMWWVFHANVPEAQTLFQSGWFVVGLLSQTLIVHMISYAPRAVYSESRCLAADADDAGGNDCGNCATVLTAGRLSAIAGVTAELFPLVSGDSGGIYDVNAMG